MEDQNRMRDTLSPVSSYNREENQTVGLRGHVAYILYDEDGKVKQTGESHNIVTTQGDRYFVDQLTDAGAATIKLMVLGTSTVAVSKADTWVGSAFAGNGSAAASQGTISPVTNSGTPANYQIVGTFGSGYATANGITRVGYTNMNPAADGLGTPNNSTTFFIAHGTVSPTVNKGANDTLVITWDITFLGA